MNEARIAVVLRSAPIRKTPGHDVAPAYLRGMGMVLSLTTAVLAALAAAAAAAVMLSGVLL